MRNRYWLSLLVAWLSVVPLQVRAQDADNIADVRCLAVGYRFAEAPDSHQKSTGTLLVLYYIGRLDGRSPALDIERLLTEQITKMSDADYNAEAIRCGKGLTVKGEQISHIGESVKPHFTK